MTRRFNDRVSLVAARIFPMSVRVVIEKVIRDSIDDDLRRLRTAWCVEICDRVTVVDSLQGREL